jgi:hypothetical protein
MGEAEAETEVSALKGTETPLWEEKPSSRQGKRKEGGEKRHAHYIIRARQQRFYGVEPPKEKTNKWDRRQEKLNRKQATHQQYILRVDSFLTQPIFPHEADIGLHKRIHSATQHQPNRKIE